MADHGDGEEGNRWFFAYAANTGAVFSVGRGRGEPPAEPTYVELMPDYGVDVPLWGLPWQDLPLDPALIERLRGWQAQFDDHFHHERGWTDAEIAAAWRVERQQLAHELRVALGPEIDVQVAPWPE